ncbi:FAD binding domain-containing protein [Stagonosporopsis vannaccii]|nr:FAD binding domain-containing protein [Stagonosporopsis vannaccii]
MRIIIVGGGIAGLSTFLHLRKHLPEDIEHNITVIESHKPRSVASSTFIPNHPNQSVSLDALSESTAVVGGGLGISPNGTRVLRDLSLELHDRVVAQGFPANNFIFKGANNWTLGMHSTSDKAVRERDDIEEVCIASSRHGLWHTLRQYVLEKYGQDVVKHGKVTEVFRDKTESGRRVRVDLIDERGQKEREYADLVIGADGVKSVVRKALFGDDDQCNPTYSGQSGVGGFCKTTIPSIVTDHKAVVFTFGGNGFFGYSSGAPTSENQLMWWSTFETSALPDTKDVDPRTIKDALFERHKHWKDPVVQEIIRNAEVESIYPTWIMPELLHWGKQGIVLIGDAAHAMDPTTGQGASQALEDSQALALSLALSLNRGRQDMCPHEWSTDQAIEIFYEVRFLRVKKIVERGKRLAAKKKRGGIVAEYTMYGFLWLLMKLPFLRRIMVGDTDRELYCWSVEQEIQKALANSNAWYRSEAESNERSPLLGFNGDSRGFL